ncbi:HAMP domain-containing histidine kinase [bacterium]|nr:HAMP domain-containing histidine kinase [bacterium]
MKLVPSFESTTPKFALRAWLALAPVVALVGVGLWLVYEEKYLANQEAREKLQEAITRAMRRLEYNIKTDERLYPDGNSNLKFHSQSSGELYIKINPSGGCLLPEWPFENTLPLPKALPWPLLTETETLLWQHAHKENNVLEALESANSFLSNVSVYPFFYLMKYREILLLNELGQRSEATSILKQLRDEPIAECSTESGMPLEVVLDFLELQFIQTELESERTNIPIDVVLLKKIHPMMARLREKPNSWTESILKAMTELEQAFEDVAFNSIALSYHFDNIQNARRFYEAIPKTTWAEWHEVISFEPRWIQNDDSYYFVTRASDDEDRFVFLLTDMGEIERTMRRWLQESLASIGEHTLFGLSLDIANKHVVSLPHATMDSFVQADNKDLDAPLETVLRSPLVPSVLLKCSLIHPEIFFERTHKRTRQMVLLIGLAGLTGFIGWLAQWRAFRRQVELGRMKSNFVASVSHELRAPIASIRLMAENLSQQKESGEAERRDYFQWIGLECRRLSSLVQNILQYSRLELGKREYSYEPVDVQCLFDETLKLMEPLAANGQITLKSEIKAINSTTETGFPEAVWDGQAVHQALVNLLDNAIKHTTKKGEVCAELLVLEKQDVVEFRVIDQGPGIDPADRERIFRPFERLGSEMTRKTKGVGIGLNLVWHTARAHEGTVSVEKAVNGGSCFVLSLPTHPKQP